MAQDKPATSTNSPEADKAWRETFAATQSPMPPKEWADKKPSPQEVVSFYDAALVKGADKARDFYTRYPDHPKAIEARKAEYNMIELAMDRFGDTNQAVRLAGLQTQLLKSSDLSEDERFNIRVGALQQLIPKLPGAADEFAKEARVLHKDFPDHDEVYQLLLMGASMCKPDTARGIAQEIVDGTAPNEVKEQAKALLEQLKAVGKPVDIQYTAVDGRKVDLTKMKGKVVLVDFWATWCSPCVGEVPDVKAAYDKLHGQGFEIVGISLDRDQEALKSFVSDHGMAWPQYFDGQQWGNKFAQKFGINSIPAMWLVDKDGNLRDVNARGDLEDKVSQLLTEKPAAAVAGK